MNFDDTNLAHELGLATAEIKSASEVLTKTREGMGDLEMRLDALEGQNQQSEKETKQMQTAIDKLHDQNRRTLQMPQSELVKSEVKNFAEFAVNGEALDTKAISEQSSSEGRAALPQSINSFVQDRITEINEMRQIASTFGTTTPDWRHLVNVKGTGSAWSGEVSTRNATATPTLEAIEPDMGELFAYAQITQWAARDLFDGRAETWLMANIVEEFARAEGEAFINGDGASKPLGLMQAPVSTDLDDARAFGTFQMINSGDAGGFASNEPDVLVEMVYGLQNGYRRNGRWLMNSNTAGVVRKFKDSDGRFLWTDSLIQGQPATLLGYPVSIVEEMPDIASGERPIAFGDMKRSYVIVDMPSMHVVRDEVTDPGNIKVYVFRRLSGYPTDSNALKFLQIAA